MSQTAPDSENWQDCQSGEIQQVASVLKRGRRLRMVWRVGMSIGAAVLFVAVTLNFLWQPAGVDPVIGGLTCSEVHAVAARFVSHELDSVTNGRIQLHLEECLTCRQLVEDMAKSHAQADQQTAVPRTNRLHHTNGPFLVDRRADRGLGVIAAL